MENNSNENVQQSTPIRKEVMKSAITIDEIFSGEYQKDGTLSAQLRQVITTKSFYPSKKVSNNLQDNLFDTEDFGFTDNEFVGVENRVTWMDVPIGTTDATLTTRIASQPAACLYRILSNKPILSDNQQYAISAGLKTKDDFANTQAVRYPDDAVIKVGETEVAVGGTLALDKNGKIQYRQIYFSKTAKEDIDLRTADKTDVYITPELEAELTGAAKMENQTI